MLSYILGSIQAFERIHGRVPVLVGLNPRHLQQLLDECPGLINSGESATLGFRIALMPEDMLPHPQVSLLSAGGPERVPLGWSNCSDSKASATGPTISRRPIISSHSNVAHARV